MPFKNQHPLYRCWRSMRQRCGNPNYLHWSNYGGRGVQVCERWRSFENFTADMGPRPTGYTLDRIDNDGNYAPENCRWATRKEQQRNRRIAVYVVIKGARYRAIELAEKANLKTDTVIVRAAAGLTLQQVMSPKRRIFKPGLALGGLANGQRQRAKTHCPKGHQFTVKNTYFTKEGWRSCRQCKREAMYRRNHPC